MDNKYLDRQEFVENGAKRIPVCIVVDRSGSMYLNDGTGISRIDRVNNGIRLFYKQTQKETKTRRAVDVCIISVGDSAEIVQDFANTDHLPKRMLVASNQSGDLVLGVRMAIDQLDLRKKTYKDNGVDYYQPWLIVMSDGRPTRKGDSGGAKSELSEYQRDVIRPRESNGKLVVFPVCITGTDETPAIIKGKCCMSNFSNDEKRLITLTYNSVTFEDLFEFLHKSASSVASGNGFLKSSSKYGDYSYRSSGQEKQATAKNIYKQSSKPDSPEPSIPDVETSMSSEGDIEEKARIEQERIRRLRAEANRYKASPPPEKPKERAIDPVLYVNGEKAFPIKDKINGQTTLTITLHKGDKAELYNARSPIRFRGFGPSYVPQNTGKYNITISGNEATAEEVEKQTSTQSLDDSQIDDEIKELLASVDDWDKI